MVAMAAVVVAAGTHTLFVYRSMGELKQNDELHWAGGCLQKATARLLMVAKVVLVVHAQALLNSQKTDSLKFSDLIWILSSNQTNVTLSQCQRPCRDNYQSTVKVHTHSFCSRVEGVHVWQLTDLCLITTPLLLLYLSGSLVMHAGAWWWWCRRWVRCRQCASSGCAGGVIMAQHWYSNLPWKYNPLCQRSRTRLVSTQSLHYVCLSHK